MLGVWSEILRSILEWGAFYKANKCATISKNWKNTVYWANCLFYSLAICAKCENFWI